MPKTAAKGKTVRGSGALMAEITKLGAQVEALSKLREAIDMRFSSVSEKIGEIRSMVQTQEKNIAELRTRAERAIGIVESTHPESLYGEIKKRDAEMGILRDKLQWTEQMIHRIMEDMKDIKRTVLEFKGMEGLRKLSKDIKADLVAIQRVKGEVEKHSDKVMSMFIELQRNFGNIAKMGIKVESLEENMRNIGKQIASLEVKSNEMVPISEYTKSMEEMKHRLDKIQEKLNGIELTSQEAKKLGGRLFEESTKHLRERPESGGAGAVSKTQEPKKILREQKKET